MAGDKKASEEPDAAALGAGDFWAGVQAGRDVKMSVGQVAEFVAEQVVEPTREELLAVISSQAKEIHKLKMQIFLGM